MTAFSVELVDELAGLGLDALKSASTDITNRPLLEAMAARGLPLIVSTGASTIEEVERAAGWLSGVRQVALLQCVSAYPAPDDGLDGIGAIAGAIGRIAGYSDHTPREDTGAAAVACGASILEKHLTLDRAAPGPDHAASLAPDGFARYVRLARAQGAVPEPAPRPREAKGVLACEAEVRRASRQSVVSARALEAGTVVGRSDLAIKRPGTGIEPHRFEEVVGRRVVRAIEADVPIRGEDVGLAESGAGVSRLETGSTECV